MRRRLKMAILKRMMTARLPFDAWWARIAETLAKQSLWPHNNHHAQFTYEDLTASLSWLPARQAWSVSAQVGLEIYTDIKPRLEHFLPGIMDLRERARAEAAPPAPAPF